MEKLKVVLTIEDMNDIIECVQDYACGIDTEGVGSSFEDFKHYVEGFIEDWSLARPCPTFEWFIYNIMNGVSFRKALHTPPPDNNENIEIVCEA